ncbi:chromosome segregation protein Spc25-domain-containing protein [Mucidula mucida]|nr:chromosome segregation protein Spc25-domain-containing protein [Mucidula mucida]
MAHTFRVPQIDLASVISSDTPSIDLKLQHYETAARKFLKTVTTYKNQIVNEETDSRAVYASEKKRFAERTHAVELETNQCKVRELELAKELSKEAEERKDAELSVAAFRRQLASLKEKCAAIDSEIEQYRAIADNLERERQRERDTLMTHATGAQPDIQTLEKALACVIEGLETDQLLIRFWSIDPNRPEREFTFVLDVGGSGYKVLNSSPPLPSLPVLVNTLNDSKDIYWFILEMRQAFVKLVPI